MDIQDPLQQNPWHAANIRQQHQTTPTFQRPSANLSTPSGGSTVARMLGKSLGAEGLNQPAMPLSLPGADTQKETQQKRGSWWENMDQNAVSNPF